MRFIVSALILLDFSIQNLRAVECRIIGTEGFPNMGMFATLNGVLGQLYQYEQSEAIGGLLIDFDVYGLYYEAAHGPNWYNYYFDPVSLGDVENIPFLHPTKKQSYESFGIRRKITRKESAELVQKYIHPRQEILRQVDHFIQQNFRDYFVLGVHYRGTDKWTEANRVPYDSVIKIVRESLPSSPDARIFVATDETGFLEAMKTQFPDQILAIDARRSMNQTGIHFYGKNQYELGKEALIDCLLLSKCNALIRTSSSLSMWSTYFNPDLPTVLLNTNFRNKGSIEPE